MELNNEVKSIVSKCLKLYGYERKQIISILIMSTLNDMPNDEAKKIYDSVINKLSN